MFVPQGGKGWGSSLPAVLRKLCFELWLWEAGEAGFRKEPHPACFAPPSMGYSGARHRMGPLATATTHSWRLALDLTEGWILGRVSTVTGRYRGPASPDSDARGGGGGLESDTAHPSRGSGRPLPQQFPEQICCLFESGNNRLQTPQGPRDPATGSSCPSLLW